jgi:RHS repeat-associated protein
MSSSHLTLRSLVPALALLTGLGGGNSVLAAHDPAPVPVEVVAKLMGKPGTDSSLADSLAAHVKAVHGLVRDGGQVDAGAMPMQLAARRQELSQLRRQFRSDEDAFAARLKSKRADSSLRSDLRNQLEARFDRLDKLMAAAQNADRGSRKEHLAALSQALKEMSPPTAELGNLTVLPGPSIRHDEPPAAVKLPASQQMPAAEARKRPEPVRLAFLGNTLLAAIPATPPEALSCGYTAADLAATPDAPQSATIQTLAAQLNYSPVKIFQYVYTNIAIQPYYGAAKGAAATLQSGAGGPTDQASLLVALLRASGIPARYVRGTVQMSDPTAQADGGRVARWLGAKSYIGASAMLALGGFSSAYGSNVVQFNHVWVEACVPYGRYRGAALDTTGERWIQLDPSVKDKEYQAGIATNVSFDYATYLSKRTNGPDSLPQEVFTRQVLSAAQSVNPAAGLDNISYNGALKPLSLDILPGSLPYEVISYTNWPGTTSPEIAQLPAAHRYRLAVGGLGQSAATNLYLPDLAQSRLTLAFKGATGSDQTALDAFRTDGNTASTVPCTINVLPVLRADGVDQGMVGTAVGLCTSTNALSLAVYLDELSSTSPRNAVTYNNIGAANIHALQAFSFQTSDALLAARNRKLLDAVAANANPNATADTLDATEGEYLHLVGLKYMRRISDAALQIGSLSGTSGESGNHLGLASSQMKVQYLFDLPYAVSRSGFLVDMPGLLSRDVDLSTGSRSWASFKLAGYAGSAYESYVWQENAQLDAVSTVRGLQFANETGIGTVTGDSSTWASVRSQLSVYPGSSATDCTYSPTTLQYPRCMIDSPTTGIQALINLGYTITLPKTLLQYSDWKGYVYASERNTANASDPKCSGAFCAGFMISGLHGGYTLGTVLGNTTYNPVINTGYAVDTSTVPVGVNTTGSVNDALVTANSVTSANGPPNVSAGDPVNMLTGNMYHNETDLSIKGRGGLPIVFARSYNSRKPVDGPLGYGWTHSFNHQLKFYGVDGTSAKLSWIDGSGAERFFATTAQAGGNISVNTTIPNPAGVFVSFKRNTDGTYTLAEKNGLTYKFESATGPSAATTAATPVYARLLSITDRKGNVLTLNYSGCGTYLCSVVDGIGRSVLTFHYTGSHLDQVTDFSGRVWKYTVDGSGNLTTFQNPLAVAGSQNPVTYSYYAATDGTNLAHAMKQYTLPRGNGMRFEYYDNGRVFRHTVVNTDGSLTTDQVNTFAYNDFRREAIQTNERGGERHFFFDANGNPLTIVQEDGGEYRYAYTVSGQPFLRTSITDPQGLLTQYAYDTNGNLTQTTLPSAATVQYGSYTSLSQPQTVKDARGNYTVLKYDSQGNLTERLVLKAGIVPAIPYTAVASQIVAWQVNGYDAWGNLTSNKAVRDFAGQITSPSATSATGPILSYSYDGNGLNATTAARSGRFNADAGATTQSASLTYDSLGRLKTGVDASFETTQFTYDALDRIIQATDRLGNLRDYRFDANGNPVGQRLLLAGSQVDSSSQRYDDSDRAIAATDAGGNVTQMGYDAAGNVIALTTPDGYLVSTTYDELNRPLSVADPENNTVSTQRDALGRPLTVTDPNHHLTTYAYWDASRNGALKSVTRPTIQSFTAGLTQSFDVDTNGNRITITEIPAAGAGQTNRVTQISYDELNRPVRVAGPQITDPVYGAICPVTVSLFDTLGRVSQVAAGRTPAPCSNAASDVTAIQSTRLYDDFSRQISETDPLGRTWNNRYDSHDNLATRTDPKAQITTYVWTTGHQLQSRSEQGGRLTTWTRNALGQPNAIQHPEASLTYTYDAAHRLASIKDSRGNKTLTYRWSPGGWLNSITDGEGKITNYRYDPSGRLAGITAPNNDELTFAFDPAGRLTEKRFANGISSRYTWNADDSLASITHAKAGTTLAANAYTYDGVGNRSANTETINGTALGLAYSYDELKRLTQVANGTATQQEAYQYDPLGNRTQKSVGQTAPTITAYLYDVANALKEIHSGSASGPLQASLAYDLNGNLQSDGTRTFTWDAIDQLSQVSNGTTTVAYAYDGLGRRTKKTVNGALTQWLHNGDQLYAEYGSSWTQPTARWSSAGLDQPVLRGQVNGDGSDGTAQYALADGLGSVIALANSADATVANQRFDAWGNKTASSGTIPNYGYTGREPDETGLIFYRARYYHPGIGRFASRDPSGLQGGINPYAYVGNNPVMRVDPTGMTAEPPSAGAPAENYAGGDCMAMNESRLGDDPEKISDAAGREGVDFSDGPVKMAAGMCYRWDDGKSSIKASPDPRADVFQYQLAPSMQGAMLNAGFGGVVKAVLGGAAKVLGLAAEDAALSGPVVLRAPPGATAEEMAQLEAYCAGCNAALNSGGLSPTGRVSTGGALRIEANNAAATERSSAAAAGQPYQGVVGHVPDTTWTGNAQPYQWMDLTRRLNSSLGGQTNGYPIGYKPTEFLIGK